MIWVFLFLMITFNLVLCFSDSLSEKFKVGFVEESSIAGCIAIFAILFGTIIIGQYTSIFHKKLPDKNIIKQDYYKSKQCSNSTKSKIIEKLVTIETTNKMKYYIMKRPLRYIHSFSFIDGLKSSETRMTYIISILILLVLLIFYYIWIRKLSDQTNKISVTNWICGFLIAVFCIYSIAMLELSYRKDRELRKQTIIEYRNKGLIDNCLYLKLYY